MDVDEQKQLFEQWVDRHQGLLIKVMRSYARQTQDQEDLFQEILFQLWKSIPRYSDEVAQTTWAYRVAMYTAIGWARKEKIRRGRTRPLGIDEQMLSQPATPADPRLEWLYDQINRLDAFDRSLAVLLLDGCSYSEMASVLGLTENHVGVKIHRIKKYLQNQIKESLNDEF